MGYAENIVYCAPFVDDETVLVLFLVVCFPLQQSPSTLKDGIEQVFPDGIPVLVVDWWVWSSSP